jgi:hypothetical protein
VEEVQVEEDLVEEVAEATVAAEVVTVVAAVAVLVEEDMLEEDAEVTEDIEIQELLLKVEIKEKE